MYLKRLTWNLSNDWLETYQKLHKLEPRIVEIYGVQNKTIYMKLLNCVTLDSCINQKYYSQTLDILNNIYKFNKNRISKFYHTDAKIGNFMVENDIVYLIDPDSFIFYDEWQ